ncbi:hypothetical protein Tco_1276556 [Tanacetum coccineum]
MCRSAGMVTLLPFSFSVCQANDHGFGRKYGATKAKGNTGARDFREEYWVEKLELTGCVHVAGLLYLVECCWRV